MASSGLPTACPLLQNARPLIVGALGTSLTWGADLADRATQAWPVRLQERLRSATGRSDLYVLNGGLRASSADFASLCFDELWGEQWHDSRGLAHAPRLDLAIIEFNWSSSASQVRADDRTVRCRGRHG